MHVVFCAHDGPGNFSGGPNAWLLRLLPDLRAHGTKVTLLVLGTGPEIECPMVSAFQRQGLPLDFYDAAGERFCLRKRLRWIVQRLNELKPDVLVPNLAISAYYAAVYASKAGIPGIGVIHSDDAFHHHLLKTFAYIGKEPGGLASVVVVSKHLESHLSKHLQGGRDPALCRIPYGVPIPAQSRTQHQGGLKICYVGRFVQEQKRVREVVEAFCTASRRLPDAVFTLIGSGPEHDGMLETIRRWEATGTVRIASPIPSWEMQDFLRSQDVFVLLSDYEGLPIALQEAMSVGLVPVCLREKSGIVELIEHRRNGWIVEDRDSSFVEALVELDGNRGLLERLGGEARRTIELDYAASVQHKAWARLLREVADTGPKRRIRLPWRLRLPEPHPDFRGEDRCGPTLSTRISRRLRQAVFDLRQAVRPRARWREFQARRNLSAKER